MVLFSVLLYTLQTLYKHHFKVTIFPLLLVLFIIMEVGEVLVRSDCELISDTVLKYDV